MNPNALPKTGMVIYAISSPSGKIYIGKTKRPYHRCHQYLRAFKNDLKDQVNTHLMNAAKKYGVDNLNMVVIESCDSESALSKRELFWMDVFRSTDRKYGYNLRRDSSTGMVTHPETSELISANLKRQWDAGVRSGHSEKMKASWAGRDRSAQSRLFSRLKTKWVYHVDFGNGDIEMDYRMLRAFGLWNGAVSAFSRHKTNVAFVKGFRIRRESVSGQ